MKANQFYSPKLKADAKVHKIVRILHFSKLVKLPQIKY